MELFLLQIFTESLLCSSRKENIVLAGELMERSQTDATQSQSSFGMGQRVAYDRAVELIVSSAQEYFNSSANLMDVCMDLAR